MPSVKSHAVFDQCGILNDPRCADEVAERARFLGVSHEAAALSLAKEWNAAEAERAAEAPRLEWVASRGGMGGPCLILKIGGRPVGHFYADPSDPVDQIDGAALVAEMAEAWNATGKPAPRRAPWIFAGDPVRRDPIALGPRLSPEPPIAPILTDPHAKQAPEAIRGLSISNDSGPRRPILSVYKTSAPSVMSGFCPSYPMAADFPSVLTPARKPD